MGHVSWILHTNTVHMYIEASLGDLCLTNVLSCSLRYPLTLCGLIYKLCTFARCRLNDHRRERKNLARSQAPRVLGEGRFLTPNTAARYSNIINYWALLLERPVKSDDFPGFKLVIMVQICWWEKVVKWPHPLHNEIDIPL